MKYFLGFLMSFILILFVSCNETQNDDHQKLKTEAIVELSKMNIVYRGVDNPVKIAVPNATSISVVAPGLINKGNGSFVLRPTTGKEVTFQIVAKMESGETMRFEKVFKIQDIGNPVGIINGEKFNYAVAKLTKKELIESTFSFDIYNFAHFRNLQVAKYSIRFPNDIILEVTGNILDQEAKKLVKKLKIGDTVFVYDIKGLGYSSAKLKRIRPFYIEIVED